MSEPGGIDFEVKKFILEDVRSLEHLEILLLLYVNSDSEWSALDVSNRLRGNLSSIEGWLDVLFQQKLLVKRSEADVLYRFDAVRADLISKVLRAYTERRVRVLELIFSKPLQRIQVFADAFKIIRKDEEEDG